MTEFEKAKEAVLKGELNTPSVTNQQGDKIPYFQYQLAVHKFNLSIMSKGMTCRGIKLKDIKAYYGLKGRSAKDCLAQFEVIFEDYKKEQLALN